MTTYKQFAFMFWDFTSGRNECSWNEAALIAGELMTEKEYPTNRQLLSACWAEYKRRNA